MKINIAQLNPELLEGVQLDKILLSQNGLTDAVDFQSVLQSLLGLQMGDFPGNQGEAPQISSGDKEPQASVTVMPLKSTRSMRSLSNITMPRGAGDSLTPQCLEPAQELLEKTQQLPQAAMEVEDELASWVKSSLEKDIQILVEGFQSEMRITEVEETTQADSIEYTMKSYETLKRLNLTGSQDEKAQLSIRGWEKTQQPDQSRAADHTRREEAPAIGLKAGAAPEVEDKLPPGSQAEEALQKVEDKHGKVADHVPDHGLKSLEGMMREVPKATKGQPVTIENTEEVKQAFFESIRETQSSGASKVTIKLNPKELGQMEVELKLQDGAIQGEIKVVSAQLKEQAQQILIPVKEALVQEQFAVRDIQITVMSPEHQQAFGEQGWQHNGQHPHYGDESLDEEAIGIPEDLQTGLTSAETGINLLA